tara:strand:- start:561 stop:806 length:246 start_codon:yes stop_codon:yes gene_type:complete
MRFEDAYDGWQSGRLTQEQAAQLLGLCDRSFRRYINRYAEAGLEGLMDKRISEQDDALPDRGVREKPQRRSRLKAGRAWLR